MADTNTNKFLDYAGLMLYDQKIKGYIAENDKQGITGVSEGDSVENYVQLTVADTNGDVKISINDTALQGAITNIQGLIAGGVHFRGVVSQLPASPFTGYTNGDIVIVGNKEYILNKPENTTGEWVELGDTTAELNRITAIEAGYIQTAENGIGTEVVLTDGTNPIDGVTDKKLKVNLKVATVNELGGIKIGYVENGKNYPVVLDVNDKAFVNVPWVDNDTKVTSVDNHYKETISTNAKETDVYSNTQIEVVNGIKYDAAGHVTSYNTVTMNFQRVTDAEINALFE